MVFNIYRERGAPRKGPKMKLTAKQLRHIINEEAGRLDEIFTPVGGIGFGDTPRPGRRSYLDLPIMGETDEVDDGPEWDKAEKSELDLATTLENHLMPLVDRIQKNLEKSQAELATLQRYIPQLIQKVSE